MNNEIKTKKRRGLNLPNSITISRIALIPIMIIVLFIPGIQDTNIGFLGMSISQIIFAGLFVLASLTDFLDGYIARKTNQITTFGKFLDPLADKLLVLVGFIFLFKFDYWNTENMRTLNLGLIYSGVILILMREFLVSGARMMMANKNIVVPANMVGKAKTVVTMLANIFFLFNDFNFKELMGVNFAYVTFSIYFIAIVLTVVSGIIYLYQAREVIFESK